MSKKFLVSLLAMLAGISLEAAETPSLSVNSVLQRYPWNGLVDIKCTVSGMQDTTIIFKAVDKSTGNVLPVSTLTYNGVAFANGTSRLSNGTHRFVWDASEDVGNEYVASNVVMRISNACRPLSASKYIVIDVSGGPSATSYNVEYLDDVPDGGWQNEHKTTKIVLRGLSGGSFKSNGGARTIFLTEPVYMGVFEVTQKQYDLVVGTDADTNPSEYKGDARPVENVSWDDITGEDGFLARLSQKTSLTIKLPTEAQWEYACRAGSEGELGEGFDGINVAGRYTYNKDQGIGGYSQHTKVGSYNPNAWGFYDMHGNVYEWCSDKFDTINYTAAADPAGAITSTSRAMRGGSWREVEGYCTSGARTNRFPADKSNDVGFRISCAAGR